jgi:hypothetical protein
MNREGKVNVDGHEKPATVEYRYNFIEQYFHYELRAFRWIQITEKEASELEGIGVLVKWLGYRYNQP